MGILYSFCSVGHERSVYLQLLLLDMNLFGSEIPAFLGHLFFTRCQYPVSTEVCLLASSNSNVPADPNWQALVASMLVFIRAEQGLRLTMPSLGSLNWQEDSGRLLLKIRARVGARCVRVTELRWVGCMVGVFCLHLGNLEARADSLRQIVLKYWG